LFGVAAMKSDHSRMAGSRGVGVQHLFLNKAQAIDYARNRACFRSGEIRVLDASGAVTLVTTLHLEHRYEYHHNLRKSPTPTRYSTVNAANSSFLLLCRLNPTQPSIVLIASFSIPFSELARNVYRTIL